MRRAPLVHFLAVGLVAFLVRGWFGGGTVGREILVVASADEVDDEICFREALRRGLDRGSPVVRDRLVTLMRFLGERDASADELVREGRELGLHRADLVIRRHLIEDLRARIEQAPNREPVTEAELRALFERDRERYRRPARVAFAHVFFDAGHRGEASEAEAERAVARLRTGELDLPAARAAADPFLHGLDQPPLSAREIEARFGREFENAMRVLPSSEWLGPIRSAFGFHAVRVRERSHGSLPEMAAVRTDLERRVRRERGEQRYRRELAAWRSRYDVIIEPAR